MTHEEALELLELAAAEPEGFERLAAGDRPEAAALAGHLAGCPSCRAEHDALRRLAVVLRTVLPELPADDLRERTLATVAALGRERPARGAPEPAAVEPAAAAAPALPARIPSGRRPGLVRAVGLAAAILLAVGAGFMVGAQTRDGDLRREALVVGALERLAATSLAVAGAPDARTVALAAPDGRAEGRILFSATTRQLVVVASGLAPPPAGREYRCWVEIGGARTAVGRMVFAASLAYWAGPAEVLAPPAVPTGFGISLVATGTTGPGEPVLEGRP